jgi:chromosome segregation ATPase
MTDNATDLQSKLTKLEQDNEEILNQLSTSEIRVSSLQTSLAEAQGQLQAFTTNTDNFMSENKHLRQQLDQVTTKFAVQSREMSALRDVLAEKDIEIGLRENRIKEVEDQLAQAQQKLTQLEEAEAELSTELKVFGDMLMSGTLTEMSHRFESKYEDSDYMVAHYSSTNSKLQMLRQTLLNVKNKATSIEKQQMKTREVARVMREEFDELKDECNQLKKQLNLVTIERDNIHTQLAVHMEQLTTVGRECREALDDKEQLLSSAEEFAQRIRSLLRTLDGAIADAVSRAGVITAGKLMGFQGDKIHLSPSQLISSREFIGSSGNPILDKTNVDYGASALLARSVSDIEHTLNSLCQALETLAEDSTAKKAALDKVELTLSEKELTFAKDRAFFLDRISSLEKNLEHNQKSLTVSQLDSKALQNEIDILKEQLNEVTSKNSEIELEFNDALNNIEALKSALSDAESLVMESRARMRSMQTDIDNRNNEIKSLHDEIDSGRKKLMDAIIQLEKTNNNLERIKSEKDAVDNVRKSLESELDRSRVEANNLKLQARNNVQDVKSSFEVEKLLAALGTTLDQVSNTLTPLSAATTTSTSGSRSNLLTPISSGSPTMDNMSVPQTDRVDSAVKRLGDLRIWCRDEFRSRRILEEKIESLQRDLLASQTAAEDAQSHWKRLMASSNDRDVEVREKAREISDLQATMARKQEEIDRLKKDLSNARDELDEEKRSKQKLSSESQAKDSEIFRQRLEHESLTATIARLQEQLSSSKDRINELSNDAEQKAEQVLVCKANNARLSATLEMLERGFDKDRNDRGLMEQRLLDFDNNSGSVERFKVKIAELENSLSALREKCHNITREKDTAQMALERQTIELDSLRRKLTTVEARLEGCNKEKQSMTAQIDNVRQTVAQMKIKVESEVSLRLKAEAALQAINNEKKPFGDHYSALVDEVADNLKKDEDEKQALRNQIHSLKLTMEYKESQYSVNEEKTRSLERELHRLMSQVGDWNNEIESMQLRSRALRREGKKARSRILHASRTVNEIINMAKADVSATGFGIVSPHNNYDTLHMKAILSATTPSTRSGLDELDFEHGFDDSFSTDDNIPLLGLEKALGLDDLVSLVDNLQHITTWIRDIPRNQMEMQAVIQRLENEKIRLTKELNESEVRGEERVMKLRQEVQQLNIQLSELRRGDGMSNQLNLHISALENALRQERTEKEKAVNLNQKYREESQIISLELANAQQEILMLRNGTNQVIIMIYQ